MSRQGSPPTTEFEEFARARTPVLLRSAWLLCGDAHLAEDLVQETLAKVYVRWHAPFRSPIENPVAYSHTALTRTFLSSRRKRSSTERPAETLPDQPVADASGATETRMALTEALAGLGREDRTVLVLRYLEDLSVEETAQRMDVSAGAVRSRCLRALDRLRPLVDTSLTVTPERGTTHD